jgi:predicted Zn-dependent peptidase
MVPFGQVPKVTIQLVVQAGNAFEHANEVWLADLTGKMLQEGTEAESADAVARQFASMGGNLSVNVGSDGVAISADVLAERGPEAAALIADVVRAPRFPADALGRIKASLARSLAINRSSPQATAQEKFDALIYGDHPYGRTFPTEAMLAGYTLEQVRDFHRRFYGANRARLYVAGVFDQAAMSHAIAEAFSSWRSADPLAMPPAPARQPRSFALVDRPDAPQSTVYVGVRVPDPSQPDWMAMQVTDALLGGAFGSRITANIREQKGYTYSPFSSVNTHATSAHWVEIADVTTNDTGPAIKEIFAEIDRLRREAPPDDELTGIKKNLAGVFVLSNTSRTGVISQLAFVDQHELGDDYLRNYVSSIMSVTAEQVRRAAEQYLAPSAMTLVVVGDTKTIKGQVAPWEHTATVQQ